jgi:oxygen-independent coproporphyrinogen-3 oxidase
MDAGKPTQQELTMVPHALLARYPTSAPRYVSYPSALVWQEGMGQDVARQLMRSAFAVLPRAASIYVHVPFCHSLCWYCGCNMMVTRDQGLVDRYVDAVVWEARQVAAGLDEVPPVVQMHWGGGTPTFLSPQQLERLFNGVAGVFRPQADAELSLEVHPPVTSNEQIQTLRRLGFTRVSMGVQDFDPVVQEAVHRHQPFEQTARLVEECRRVGMVSINMDLMYGLPYQNPQRFLDTVQKVGSLRPDRVALFGYAHVPHVKKQQNLLKIETLPTPPERLALFETAANALLKLGYRYIGLDHFALADNELSVAQANGTLRRNFMGYTTCKDSHVLAFGASAIGDMEFGYLQNARDVEEYLTLVGQRRLPVVRGLVVSEEDRLRRNIINRLFCALAVDKAAVEADHGVRFDEHFAYELEQLAAMEKDGLVKLTPGAIKVTTLGQPLLRNIAMVFDAYVRQMANGMRMSQAV